jgi:cadmium resistance protein CadD (predicted permease)
VGNLFAVVTAAALVFAGTNIDDMVVLTVLFLSARAVGRPRRWQVWTGQYAGFAALVGASAVAAVGLIVVADDWVGLLGLLPLALGVRGLVTAVRSRGDDQPAPPVVAAGAGSVAGVTIANGADNISVYTPMFRTIGLTSSLITLAVFVVGVAVWCLAGSWMGSHPRVVRLVQRFGHWIVPGVFIVIGTLLLVRSGVLTCLAGGQ